MSLAWSFAKRQKCFVFFVCLTKVSEFLLPLSYTVVSNKERLLWRIVMRTFTFRRPNSADEQLESLVAAWFWITVSMVLIDFNFEAPHSIVSNLVLLGSCCHQTFGRSTFAVLPFAFTFSSPFCDLRLGHYVFFLFSFSFFSLRTNSFMSSHQIFLWIRMLSRILHKSIASTL